ncbi:SDR family NAD(P)-dependent oxidoreductase [Domibacillus robiginosus]|uniref:SDR family NAD(P)-dependent oxidoreductase n=1 Tax=Domibacillus robiginosus TaxID=1071054 RepID=UPI00067C59A5|nr:SDR family oxidoreductase [Domibacillus robiginosus]
MVHNHQKVVVITGASSGLGAELAKRAGSKGFHLVLLARRLDRLKELQQELLDKGASVRVFEADVTDRQRMEQVFEEIGTVDVLINNAGVGFFTWAHESKPEETKQMIDVNVSGLIGCCEQVIPQMMARRSGHIINIASQAGKMATPKSAVYAATKHAVLGYTNSLRMEMSRFGVFVTAINPGPIATPFFNQADPEGTYVKNAGRFMLKPDKVAEKTVAVIGRPVREVNLPRWMAAGSRIHSLIPNTVEKLGRNAFFKK